MSRSRAHDDRPIGAGPTIGRDEIAAESRSRPQQREVGGRDQSTAHPLGDAACGERHRGSRIAGDLLKARLLLLQSEVVRDREAPLVGRRVHVDAHEPIGLRVGERLHQHGVNRAEHRRRRTDAETDGEDDRDGQNRRARQAPKAVSQVARDVPHPLSCLRGGAPARGFVQALAHESPGELQRLPAQPGFRRPITVTFLSALVELLELAGRDRTVGLRKQDARGEPHEPRRPVDVAARLHASSARTSSPSHRRSRDRRVSLRRRSATRVGLK